MTISRRALLVGTSAGVAAAALPASTTTFPSVAASPSHFDLAYPSRIVTNDDLRIFAKNLYAEILRTGDVGPELCSVARAVLDDCAPLTSDLTMSINVRGVTIVAKSGPSQHVFVWAGLRPGIAVFATEAHDVEGSIASGWLRSSR